jgi:hypothetical protein
MEDTARCILTRGARRKGNSYAYYAYLRILSAVELRIDCENEFA